MYPQKVVSKITYFLLASWKPLTKREESGSRAGSGSGSVIQCTDPRIRLCLKMSRKNKKIFLHTTSYWRFWYGSAPGNWSVSQSYGSEDPGSVSGSVPITKMSRIRNTDYNQSRGPIFRNAIAWHHNTCNRVHDSLTFDRSGLYHGKNILRSRKFRLDFKTQGKYTILLVPLTLALLNLLKGKV